MLELRRLLHPFSAAIAAFAAASVTMLSPTEVAVVEILRPGIAGATLRVQVYSGSAEDPEGKEGAAWLTAAVIRQEAADRAGALPGRIEAAVGKDITLFSVETTGPNPGPWIEIVRAALATPALDAAVVSAQRGRQQQLLDDAAGDPAALAGEAFDAFVYRGHPYAHAALGRKAAVAGLTRDDLAAFHAAHYRKGNIAVGLAAGLTDSQAESIRDDLAGVPDGDPPRRPGPLAWLPRPRVLLVQAPASTSVKARIGHPLNVTRAHPDFAALSVVRGALAAATPGVVVAIETVDGGAAALPRRQQALVLGLEASGPAEAAASIRAALSAMEAMARSGPDEAGLKEAVRMAAPGSPAAGGDPRADLSARMDELLWRAPGAGARLAASLGSVTLTGAREAASRHLYPGRAAIVAVAPDARALADALIAAGPGPAIGPDDVEIVDAGGIFP